MGVQFDVAAGVGRVGGNCVIGEPLKACRPSQILSDKMRWKDDIEGELPLWIVYGGLLRSTLVSLASPSPRFGMKDRFVGSRNGSAPAP